MTDPTPGGADRDLLYGGEGNNTYIVTPGMGLDNAMGASISVAVSATPISTTMTR